MQLDVRLFVSARKKDPESTAHRVRCRTKRKGSPTEGAGAPAGGGAGNWWVWVGGCKWVGARYVRNTRETEAAAENANLAHHRPGFGLLRAHE